MEARFARKHIDSEHLGVSYFKYGPSHRSNMGHRHREQEEAYVVIGGAGRAKLDDEVVELQRWDVIRVAPEYDQAYLNLARVYAIQSEREKARQVLLELLKQHPDHAQAKAELGQLAQ